MSDFDVLNTSVEALSLGLTEGRYTSEGTVARYLDQIDRHNKRGLKLNAVIDVLPRENAIDIARTLDSERREGRSRSLLHGVPVIVKEVISTKEEDFPGLKTTGGTFALEGSTVTKNAPVVNQLVKAGMIIIGKGNCTVANNWYGGVSDGWSPRGGLAHTACVDRDFSPGGSSSGCAVAVSAGFAPLAVGVETFGSIVSPARRVGAVAIKPSGRRVPKAGIFGISELIDTAGPMGRSVWEVATLLDTLVTDPHESFLSVIEYPRCDSPKFGVPPSQFFMESLHTQDEGYKYTRDAKEAETLFTKVVEGLNDVRTVHLPAVSRITKWQKLENVHRSKGPMERILMTQFVQGFDLFVSEYLTGGDNKTLADVVRWNDAHRGVAGLVGPEGSPDAGKMFERCLLTGGVEDVSYQDALRLVDNYRNDIDALFTVNGLDVLMFPVGLTMNGSSAPMIAASGQYPLGTVPIGQLSNGQPYGVYLMGRHGEDGTVLRAMSHIERMKPRRPVPNRLLESECVAHASPDNTESPGW